MPQSSAELIPEVVMTIVHNLCQNLNNINSVSDLITALNSNPDSEREHWLEYIQRNVIAALYEVNNLLLWYQAPLSTPIEISALLSTVNASFQTHANTRKVALSLNMPDVPVWASGLELALKQVFMIPISLAVFSSKQGSHITVALESQENAAIFSVSTDDANGIPADLSQVGHYSSIPEHPGLHSGMWLVLGLVQQLEGQCDFGRFDKHIQTIRIKLPLAMV